MINAGRGYGKTRAGTETVKIWSNDYPRIHLVAATASDVRDVMIEGESGLLSIFPKRLRPHYEPSKRRITFTNGCVCELFSADEPDRLRGPQCYKAWADELAAWRYPEAWDQLNFGLRLGDNPQVIVTTTPRPTKLIKELVKDDTTVVTTGSTYENKANLSPVFIDKITKKYDGTTLGRQELYAEILDEIKGALWSRKLIRNINKPRDYKRIVVAIDPAVTSKKKARGDSSDSDETAIVVGAQGFDGRGYVLDNISGIWTPNTWASKAIMLYDKWKADVMVGEVNNGGDLIETVIKNIDSSINYKSVHASRGKITRAEPVVALYEQGTVDHLGIFSKLEDEMTTWTPEAGYSPNNIDALVWCMTELLVGSKTVEIYE